MKSRLRHPIRSLKEPFGKAGLTVAILALVLALVGGAYAAGGLTKSQEKQVTKIAKKYAGKPGAAGAAGANGTNGTAGTKGDTGAAGSNGTNGTNGTAGTNGTNGKTVLNGTVDPGTGVGTTGDFYINTTTDKIFGPKPSPAGAWPAGVELKGANGTTGFTETLPSGETETGTWAYGVASEEEVEITQYRALPFNIPLAAAPTEVVYVKFGEEEVAGCTGGTASAPKADPGKLCIYELIPSPSTEFKTSAGMPYASTTGAIIGIIPKAEFAQVFGAWAVTAN